MIEAQDVSSDAIKYVSTTDGVKYVSSDKYIAASDGGKQRAAASAKQNVVYQPVHHETTVIFLFHLIWIHHFISLFFIVLMYSRGVRE